MNPQIKTLDDVRRVFSQQLEAGRNAWRALYGDKPGFSQTIDGHRLLDEHQRAMELRDNSVFAFGGVVRRFDELAPEAQELLCSALAEHACNPDKIPADVARSICASPRLITHAQAFEVRRNAARADVYAAVERVLDDHGLEPAAWPAERIDEIARMESRLAVVDRLAERAGARDPEWRWRKTREQT